MNECCHLATDGDSQTNERLKPALTAIARVDTGRAILRKEIKY